MCINLSLFACYPFIPTRWTTETTSPSPKIIRTSKYTRHKKGTGNNKETDRVTPIGSSKRKLTSNAARKKFLVLLLMMLKYLQLKREKRSWRYICRSRRSYPKEEIGVPLPLISSFLKAPQNPIHSQELARERSWAPRRTKGFRDWSQAHPRNNREEYANWIRWWKY